MAFIVNILGSGSAKPSTRRHQPAQLVIHGATKMLVDCGEGTQLQLCKQHIGIQTISHIFISHLHGDHFFGLIGLLSTQSLLGKQSPTIVYAHAPLLPILQQQIEVSGQELKFQLDFRPLPESGLLFKHNKFEVHTFPLKHGIPANGFLFAETIGKRKFKPNVVKSLRIPIAKLGAIQAGADFVDANGTLHRNEEITLPPTPPTSYAYCSDTAYYPEIVPHIKNVNVLYHEATFAEERVDIADSRFHSTARQAAMIAQQAGAGKLILGHFSSRYKTYETLLAEAQEVFLNTVLAEEQVFFSTHENESVPDHYLRKNEQN